MTHAVCLFANKFVEWFIEFNMERKRNGMISCTYLYISELNFLNPWSRIIGRGFSSVLRELILKILM